MEVNNVKNALEQFSRGVVEKAKRNLPNGRLQKSIGYELEIHKNSFSLSFLMEDYGKFQDLGVSGKEKKFNTPYSFKNDMPHPKVFDKWTIKRGLAPRSKTGQFQSRKSLKFALSRHIFKNGIKPKMFFTNPFKSEFQELPKELVEMYGLDVENFIKFTLK